MSDGSETHQAKCMECGNWMQPYNPIAEAHLCRTCLEDIQVGNREN